MRGMEARLKRKEKVVGVKMRRQLKMDMFSKSLLGIRRMEMGL